MDSPAGRLGAYQRSWRSSWTICAGHGRNFMASRDDFERANKRAKDLQARVPRAVSARYDRKIGRIVIDLSSRVTLAVSPGDVEGLEHAHPSQLTEIEISPSGFCLHFPAIDADVYVPGLLEGVLGSKSWMAARLGQIGGRSRSTAKKTASRANGKLGGRPRKARAVGGVRGRRTSRVVRKRVGRRAGSLRRQPAGG